MKFTWSDQKSIILTRAVVAGAIAGCGIMTVSGPWLTRWMVSAHALPPASGPVLLGMGYVCAVLAFVMLVSLYKFLRRIEAGAVFVPANVTALRRISWCCAGAAVVCLAAALYHSRPLDEAPQSYPDGLCAVIGSEGQGLTDAALQACDMAVRIPMTDLVESLNAGVAGSVLLWHFRGV